jgi:hypothetical protein
MSAAGLQALEAALVTRGFVYLGPSGEQLEAFEGSLPAAGAQHQVKLTVDMTGLEPPRVVVKIPAGAPKILAHIGGGGYLCYAAKGTLVLDVFNLPGQVLSCVDRAAAILDLSLRGQMVQDLEEEFFVFWGGDPCFLDVASTDIAGLSLLFFSDKGLAFVSGNPQRTEKKLKALNFTLPPNFEGSVAFAVTTTANPRPLQENWPPRTVADVLRWQQELDPAAAREIERQLLKASIGRKSPALCVVKAPRMQYAFWADVHGGVKLSPAKALASARAYMLSAKVHTMWAMRIDDEYVSQRNTPNRPTLAGKRIALVGCGTIGGFLAELLVKAGAGLGRGELLLVDPDTLMPHNVGRHRLGLNYALQNKATGLRTELLLGAPTANIRDLPVRVQDAELGHLDLLIDATGEEALSHLLTRAADAGSFTPTLTAWIEGPGVAVRTLLRDSGSHACTRCLGDHARTPLFPATTEELPSEFAGHGCESIYVPFPATVSVQAACLAAEAVSDWLGGVTSPRLRTRITRSGFTQGTADRDVPRREACPACTT